MRVLPKKPISIRWPFIVGMPRTGTTLLERIIRGLAGGKTTGENATLSQVVSQSK